MKPFFYKSGVLSILTFLLFAFSAQAQKFELGKVSIAELQEKTNPNDTTAAAAILYNKGKTTYKYDNSTGFSVKHEYEFRIKIYKKEGLNWADFKVPYYVGYENLNNEMVKFSDGMTYNLQNGVIVKTKLTGEGRFKKDVNEFWNEASIAMPNVKVGSVIEFKYTLTSENITEFPDYCFQYEIPVNYSEYRTEIPQFFVYKPILSGFKKIESESKIANGYQNFTNQYNQTVNLSFQQINSIYTARNVAALKSEPYVGNLSNYRSFVSHELEKTRFPEAPEKNYAMTWEGVAKMIYKEDRFGKELKTRSYFEAELAAYIKNTATNVATANAVFEFVKAKMNWDGKYGYLTKKGVKKAFEDKTGNTAEINLMLVSMLNHAGINANPVLISTVSNGIPVFPNRTIFNDVIAGAEIDGKIVLFDATDKNATMNILPLRDLNWNGRLIRQDGTSEEIPLFPQTTSKEVVTVVASLDAQGKFTGKARTLKTDYEAFGFRDKFRGVNKDNYLEKLEASLNDMQITQYSIENENDLLQPITETFTFASNNNAEFLGENIVINPMLGFMHSENPFTAEKREYPIYYAYPFQKKIMINIEIPEGFEIVSVPVSTSISTGENVGFFSYATQVAGRKIQITMSSEIKMAMLSAEFYDPLKAFYKQMIEKLNEKIVLKKK